MAKEAHLKVVILDHTSNPQQIIVAAIRQCYSKVGAEELMEKTSEATGNRLISQVEESGHVSTTEHASFNFAIEGISRACSHQLVRHRVGWSYSQQSQRYVDLSEIEYVMPPKIKADEKLRAVFIENMQVAENNYRELIQRGVAPEDARFVLPNACETKIVATANVASLRHFFELRCCRRAQWEIRGLADEMLAQVREIAPRAFKIAGPTCVTEGICWEGKLSCNRWQAIEGAELRVRGSFAEGE